MSPRSTIQNEEIRQKSKANIMKAALTEFGLHGFEATSIAQIAKRAEVSKGLLYNYFESKENLVEQLILEAVNENEQAMGAMITEDPAQTLEGILRWLFRELRENTKYWKLTTELSFKLKRFEFVHDLALAKMTEFVAFGGNMLEQLGFEHPEQEARVLGALLDGIAIHYITMGKDYPLDEMESFLIDKYCNRK
jgi:AcrR family transcriptional regulator